MLDQLDGWQRTCLKQGIRAITGDGGPATAKSASVWFTDGPLHEEFDQVMVKWLPNVRIAWSLLKNGTIVYATGELSPDEWSEMLHI